jgi:hypothetical protein
LVVIRALYLFCLLAFFLGALEDLVDDVRTEIDDVSPDGDDGGKVAVGGRDDIDTEVGVGGEDVGAEVGVGGRDDEVAEGGDG